MGNTLTAEETQCAKTFKKYNIRSRKQLLDMFRALHPDTNGGKKLQGEELELFKALSDCRRLNINPDKILQKLPEYSSGAGSGSGSGSSGAGSGGASGSSGAGSGHSQRSAASNITLARASQNGDIEMVKQLIEAGADVNANYGIALSNASNMGHVEIAKLLIYAGADVNANHGFALGAASMNGHVEIVRQLLQAGADPTANNSFALNIASMRGHAEIVELLFETGFEYMTDLGDELVEYVKNVVQYPESSRKDERLHMAKNRETKIVEKARSLYERASNDSQRASIAYKVVYSVYGLAPGAVALATDMVSNAKSMGEINMEIVDELVGVDEDDIDGRSAVALLREAWSRKGETVEDLANIQGTFPPPMQPVWIALKGTPGTRAAGSMPRGIAVKGNMSFVSQQTSAGSYEWVRT